MWINTGFWGWNRQLFASLHLEGRFWISSSLLRARISKNDCLLWCPNNWFPSNIFLSWLCRSTYHQKPALTPKRQIRVQGCYILDLAVNTSDRLAIPCAQVWNADCASFHQNINERRFQRIRSLVHGFRLLNKSSSETKRIRRVIRGLSTSKRSDCWGNQCLFKRFGYVYWVGSKMAENSASKSFACYWRLGSWLLTRTISYIWLSSCSKRNIQINYWASLPRENLRLRGSRPKLGFSGDVFSDSGISWDLRGRSSASEALRRLFQVSYLLHVDKHAPDRPSLPWDHFALYTLGDYYRRKLQTLNCSECYIRWLAESRANIQP